MPTPTIGHLVHYQLSEQDAEQVNRRRADFDGARREGRVATGHVAHFGNHVRAGEVYPAMVVRVWAPTSYAAVQLQVFLDGSDTLWATSRTEGDEPGQWSWPVYQHGQDLRTAAGGTGEASGG